MAGQKVTKLTLKKNWKEIFIKALAKNGNISVAAKAAKVSRKTAYEHKESDSEFAEAWQEALEQSIEAMEAEAFRRAVTGTNKPIYHQGEKIDTVKEYSDTLLIFLMKAHRPDMYRDNSRVTNLNIDVSQLSDAALERIASGEDPIKVITGESST